ncbi:MAG: NUDIX domain-containing protein [Desulfohalobiaceae bacterium]
MSEKKWKVLEPIVSIENPWLKLVGEYLQDDQGRHLTYWSVVRPDSVLIIPIQQGQIILPSKYYRHGVQEMTHDFPGGRLDPGMSREDAAESVLQRELGLQVADVQSLKPINSEGWLVDSSFSSQRVYAFEGIISAAAALEPGIVDSYQPADLSGARSILAKLVCLQCRCALLQWMTDNLGS